MNKIPYEERAKVYADALDTYGLTGQLLKALEELTEVQLEIYRILEGRPDIHHLAEEVADATLMLEQIRLFFGINEEVCKVMDAKVLRLQYLIAGEIKKMPTVDAVEVVHGCNVYDHNTAFECSVCGWGDCDTLTADTAKYNYCPNCGAKMDGDGNG